MERLREQAAKKQAEKEQRERDAAEAARLKGIERLLATRPSDLVAASETMT